MIDFVPKITAELIREAGDFQSAGVLSIVRAMVTIKAKQEVIAEFFGWSRGKQIRIEKELESKGLIGIIRGQYGRTLSSSKVPNCNIPKYQNGTSHVSKSNFPSSKLEHPMLQNETYMIDVNSKENSKENSNLELGDKSPEQKNEIEVIDISNGSILVQEDDPYGTQLEPLKKEKVPPKRKRFTPPTIEQAEIHISEKMGKYNKSGDALDVAENFINFYESKGWKVGSSKMVNWTAAATNWVKRLGDINTTGKPWTDKPKGMSVVNRYSELLKEMNKNK